MTKTTRTLIKFFRPESYEVALNVYPENATFKGEVRITGLRTGPPSRRLTFNQHNLKISVPTITRHNRQTEQSMTIIRINHHQSFSEVRLHTGEQLYNGNYNVTMNFRGKIGKYLKDNYPVFSALKNKQKFNSVGIENYLTGDLFPCIIDPGSKAAFNLTITAA
ncbi:MAG TPA: hypothetical protein VMQ52_03035 [Candidatus Saccharimonadales bacterium]|nr:hypothetical protein [Candidatus Saccharimonadales bacterium]